MSLICWLSQETKNWTLGRPPCCFIFVLTRSLYPSICLVCVCVCIHLYFSVCVHLIHMTDLSVIKPGLNQLLLALFYLFVLVMWLWGWYVYIGQCVCVHMLMCMPRCKHVHFSEVTVMGKQSNPLNKRRGQMGTHTCKHINTEHPQM